LYGDSGDDRLSGGDLNDVLNGGPTTMTCRATKAATYCVGMQETTG
jgi:hypothetical protein